MFGDCDAAIICAHPRGSNAPSGVTNTSLSCAVDDASCEETEVKKKGSVVLWFFFLLN